MKNRLTIDCFPTALPRKVDVPQGELFVVPCVHAGVRAKNEKAAAMYRSGQQPNPRGITFLEVGVSREIADEIAGSPITPRHVTGTVAGLMELFGTPAVMLYAKEVTPTTGTSWTNEFKVWELEPQNQFAHSGTREVDNRVNFQGTEGSLTIRVAVMGKSRETWESVPAKDQAPFWLSGKISVSNFGRIGPSIDLSFPTVIPPHEFTSAAITTPVPDGSLA